VQEAAGFDERVHRGDTTAEFDQRSPTLPPVPLHIPEAAGPQDPATSTPPRAPGSIRRTSTIDTARPDGLLARMVMEGHARDLLTPAEGAAVVTGEASVLAHVDGKTRQLQSIETSPVHDGLAVLAGVVVGPGFRGRVDEVAADLRGTGSLLYLLLDDLPGTALVSGYAQLRGDVVGKTRSNEYAGVASDLCAGWASDGSMIAAINEHKQNPAPIGPPAPDLRPAGDIDAFHTLPVLAPTSTRRLRRIDVGPADDQGVHAVDVLFRDSYVDDRGNEEVLHEYSVTATVDGRARTILAIEATPDVLPWIECPQAIASATRLVGDELRSLRTHVRSTFVGTTTCTHLNDVLRGLADVGPMFDTIAASEPAVAW
jgi:hypothetical protein